MLDFRIETFLTLCQIGSYTKTAEMLHITQPAVSQHIKYLEQYYNTKLFYYESKALLLTEKGKLLQDFALTMRADSSHLLNILSLKNEKQMPIIFGATLTIGEYVMPTILAGVMKQYPDLHITMSVDNTQVLLKKLKSGIIDFAFLEGYFDKASYDGAVLSEEKFIPVCSNKSKLAGRKIKFDDILGERLILREKGSGTRDIFEHLLCMHNLKLDNFKSVCEIGNMSAIKRLVFDDFGITFMYKAAVNAELISGDLMEVDIDGYSGFGEFNFVFLKNSLHQAEYMKWFNHFKNTKTQQDNILK